MMADMTLTRVMTTLTSFSGDYYAAYGEGKIVDEINFVCEHINPSILTRLLSVAYDSGRQDMAQSISAHAASRADVAKTRIILWDESW